MIRTLEGKTFSTYLADRLHAEHLFRCGLMSGDVANKEIQHHYEMMDRMISGEFDPLPADTTS
jgi:hypothetical protein